MTAGAFTLPDGTRVRTSSQRRYVLWRHWPEGWSIYKRSDSIDTLRRFRYGDDVMIDTKTGEVIR